MKKPEFKKGDVVIIHDTRNFYYQKENEQNDIINYFPIPLGVIDSFNRRADLSTRVYVHCELSHGTDVLGFHTKSLEKIDHINPKDWGELEPEG